jgi:hypothetical protein
VLRALVILAALAAPARADEPKRPWYSDTAGNALVAAGTGGILLGGVLVLSARTDVAKANQGAAGGITLAEYNDLSASADDKQLWGSIAAGAGAALVIGGVVRYLTADRVMIAPSTDRAGLQARWTF